MNIITRFFLFCSGANIDVLENCPTEIGKYACLGGSVLTTATLGMLSLRLALGLVLPELSGMEGWLIAGAYGLALFNIERLLLSSTRPQKGMRGRILTVLPRVAIALVLGVLISEPVLLHMFRTEIAAQLTRDRATVHQLAQEQADSNPAYADIQTLTGENHDLAEQIAAHKVQRDIYYKEYLEEADGISGTGRRGKGLVFAEKGERLKEAEREYREFARETQAHIAQNEKRLASLRGQKDGEVAMQDEATGRANGLLAQIQALDELMRAKPVLATAHNLLAGALILFDCMPIFIKLSFTGGGGRPYDVLMATEEECTGHVARVRSAEAKAEADTVIAVMDAHFKTLQQQQIAISENQAKQIAEAQREVSQELIDQWKEDLKLKVRQNPAKYISTAVSGHVSSPGGGTPVLNSLHNNIAGP